MKRRGRGQRGCSVKRKTKGSNLDVRLAAIEAVEEAARKLEEASDKYEEANKSLIQAIGEKSEADKALRTALRELRQAKQGSR